MQLPSSAHVRRVARCARAFHRLESTENGGAGEGMRSACLMSADLCVCEHIPRLPYYNAERLVAGTLRVKRRVAPRKPNRSRGRRKRKKKGRRRVTSLLYQNSCCPKGARGLVKAAVRCEASAARYRTCEPSYKEAREKWLTAG